MANNTDETGKVGGKRPYATIDLKATEVGGGEEAGGSTWRTASAGAAAASDAKTDTQTGAATGEAPSAPGLAARASAALAATSQRLRSLPALAHVAAGAVGAIIVLLLSMLLPERGPGPARPPEMGDLTRRLADVEGVLGMRPGGAAGLRTRVDELSRTVGGLGEVQARHARETKALEARIGAAPPPAPELAGRLTRLEETLAALSSTTQPGQSGQPGPPPEIAALSARLADVEKAARGTDAALRIGTNRFDGELAAIRTEAGRLAQRLEGIKGEVEERMRGAAMAADLKPIAAKLAAIESDLQIFLRSETERNANASRVMLALELAGLKRAIDRGEPYADEIARVKRLGGFTINLTVLERYAREGVPTLAELAKGFGKIANAMIDAETQSPDASLVERLLSGARSIVRVRKSEHAADDMSVEAVAGRMEAALKEGRLAEVIAQSKKLPPKAQLAGEAWVRKIEARHAVDQAIAEAEATLKASIGPTQAVPTEGKR